MTTLLCYLLGLLLFCRWWYVLMGGDLKWDD